MPLKPIDLGYSMSIRAPLIHLPLYRLPAIIAAVVIVTAVLINEIAVTQPKLFTSYHPTNVYLIITLVCCSLN